MPIDNKHNEPSPSLSTKLELGMVSAWQNQEWWLWLLLPISWLYGGIVWLRRYCYKVGFIKSYKAPVPVIVVGNITIGGSGKTPLIIELLKFLRFNHYNVGVISRGYGGDESKMPALVDVNSNPEEVGDEPCLIARETNAPVSVCPNRQLAIECLLKAHPNIQLIIADDGLQHYKLHRDIEWIVVDSVRGFGNRQLLPTGFLREPITRLKSGTVINHIASSNRNELQTDSRFSKHVNSDLINRNLTMTLVAQQVETLNIATNPNNVSSSHNKLNNSETLKLDVIENNNYKNPLLSEKTVYALSGIGYPQRFFNSLKQLGYDVIEKPMPDHHQFEVSDFIDLNDHPIIITSKDAVKIAPLVRNNKALHHFSIWVLPVKAVLSTECYDTLLSQLNKLGVDPEKISHSNSNKNS